MNGSNIYWRDTRNIDILKSLIPDHKTVTSLAKFCGLPISTVIYVLTKFLPDDRAAYRTKPMKESLENSATIAPEFLLAEKPKGYQYYVYGMFWKINSADRVLRHNGFEWVSSTHNKEDLKKEAAKKIRNEFE